MSKLNITFTNAWYLLLIIPALALTLIPYFRVNKRYRRNRNRITSMVLHTVVMILAIATLAGICFSITEPNYKNELILLVDCSDTEESSVTEREEFIQTVLQDGRYNNFTVGIVTFGFDQVYAAELSTDVDGLFDQYLSAPLPDTSATDIASALSYAQTLFTNPETGKIVLVTDGKETDGDALVAVRSVLAKGIRVDVAQIGHEYEGEDVQVMDIQFPEYHLNLGEEFEMVVTLQSREETSCDISVYDNDVQTGDSHHVRLSAGVQTITLRHTFERDGIHTIGISANAGTEEVMKNNSYSTYYLLQTFNKILIIEQFEGQSAQLRDLLQTDDRYNPELNGETVTILNLANGVAPTHISELLMYDQIILNNIANKDLAVYPGLDQLLYSYVNEYGGGLLTVGGNDGEGNAHAYNRSDLFNTLYQKMLPVQATDYRPPVGVVVIVDISGSMTGVDGPDGKSLAEWGLAGAKSALNALNERDYFGIMTMTDTYSSELEMTSCAYKNDIYNIIDSIELTGGGSMASPAYRRAVQALLAQNDIEKRHIVLLSDYKIYGEGEIEKMETLVNTYYSDGITFSIVGINMDDTSYRDADAVVELGHGRLIELTSSDINKITTEMREDLQSPDIEEVIQSTFHPVISNTMSSLFAGVEMGSGELDGKMTTTLDGFYGVKARTDADVFLQGNYGVPLYAQWKFGAGTVGSFMSDLNGTWSATFMSNPNGRQFLLNVISNLMPLQNIRTVSDDCVIREDNYTNHLSIYSSLAEGQTVKATVTALSGERAGEVIFDLNTLPEEKPDLETVIGYAISVLDANNNYSRASFVIKQPGTYRIEVTTLNADGTVAGVNELYKSFSYSEEYFVSLSEEENGDYAIFLSELAQRGGGTKVEEVANPIEIFANYVTEITREFDPRYLFMILAIVLMLADIAVRKFKFKWPHELIRALRADKQENQEQAK